MHDESEWPPWMKQRRPNTTMSYPLPVTYTGRPMATRPRIPNTKLQRHAVIRRLLNGRSGPTGIHTYRELRSVLAEEGYPVAEMTVRADMAELGAVKVRDDANPSVQWWVIPAWNPAAENLRAKLDPEVVEHEVMIKMTAHVSDMVVISDRIHIMTEPRAGYLVGYWLSWLEWQGIVDVLERLDGCIVYCASAEDAMLVRRRLVGEEGAGDDESEDG